MAYQTSAETLWNIYVIIVFRRMCTVELPLNYAPNNYIQQTYVLLFLLFTFILTESDFDEIPKKSKA